MKYYKTQNDIRAIDEGQEFLIEKDWIEITLDEVNSINEALAQETFDALPYSQKRASEYPPITDYIDGIVKGDTAQVQDYIDKCLAVKAKYPKSKNDSN